MKAKVFGQHARNRCLDVSECFECPANPRDEENSRLIRHEGYAMSAFSIVALFCTLAVTLWLERRLDMRTSMKRQSRRSSVRFQTSREKFSRCRRELSTRAKSPAHHHAKIRLHLRVTALDARFKRSGHRARQSLPSRRESPRRPRNASQGQRIASETNPASSPGGFHRRRRRPATHRTRL